MRRPTINLGDLEDRIFRPLVAIFSAVEIQFRNFRFDSNDIIRLARIDAMRAPNWLR